MKITRTQVLHVISTLIIAPLSGFVATEVAKILPVHWSSDQYAAIFLAGTTWAVGFCLHWLHNNAWFEKHVAPVVDVQDDTPTPPAAHARRRTSTKPVT